MDKLKYIKLENEDGSYSESIPLAVDGNYVDVDGVILPAALATKANAELVNLSLSTLQSEINGLASGSPKGTYETVAALVSANPDTGVYIITANGHIYSWTKNASSAIDLGVYQATEVANDSVTWKNLDIRDRVAGWINTEGILASQLYKSNNNSTIELQNNNVIITKVYAGQNRSIIRILPENITRLYKSGYKIDVRFTASSSNTNIINMFLYRGINSIVKQYIPITVTSAKQNYHITFELNSNVVSGETEIGFGFSSNDLNSLGDTVTLSNLMIEGDTLNGKNLTNNSVDKWKLSLEVQKYLNNNSRNILVGGGNLAQAECVQVNPGNNSNINFGYSEEEQAIFYQKTGDTGGSLHLGLSCTGVIKNHTYRIRMTIKDTIETTTPKSFWFKGAKTSNITVANSYKFFTTTEYKDYEFYLTVKNSYTYVDGIHFTIASSAIDPGQTVYISRLEIEDVTDIIDNWPVPVIWDTDWWTDIDDGIALRTLIWGERAGLCDIAGVCVDAVRDTSIPSLSKMFNYEGRNGLYIGADKQATDYNGTPSYHNTIINGWDTYSGYESLDDVEDCVTFYRKILAASAKKVNIIAVGYPNALSRLLQSPSDVYSDLTGTQLVAEKVNKLYMMAGLYPSGAENNFTRNTRSRQAGSYVCANWPTEIIFLGYEVGESVKSGNTLNTVLGTSDLLYKCLVAHGEGSNGRSSWDPMTVLLALDENPSASGYRLVRGTNIVDSSTGRNTFTENENGKHYYVIKTFPDTQYQHYINTIIEKNAWPNRKLGKQSYPQDFNTQSE